MTLVARLRFRFRKTKAFKGFIGPLGDDIPSIFPIVAGVLLFLGTIAYAASIVDQKNAYLGTRKAALGLSYIITEKGVISEDKFEEKCSVIEKYGNANNVRFLITLKRFCGGVPAQQENKDSPYYAADDGESAWKHCTNLAEDEFNELLDDEDLLPPPEKSVLLIYPIAVPCPDPDSATHGLGQINVIVWR